MNKIISRGAEAIIIENKKHLIKKRIEKGYRYPSLDEKIRKLRTRAEARLLEKAGQVTPVPRVFSSDEEEKEIFLEKINGKKLSQSLDKMKNKASVAEKIGIAFAKIHDSDIIHGDPTTSNMILKNSSLYLIDFGLGFQSSRIEDKAVDLHVIHESLVAKHPEHAENLWLQILTGYKKSKNHSQVLKQLEKVEKRGRYKAQY